MVIDIRTPLDLHTICNVPVVFQPSCFVLLDWQKDWKPQNLDIQTPRWHSQGNLITVFGLTVKVHMKWNFTLFCFRVLCCLGAPLFHFQSSFFLAWRGFHFFSGLKMCLWCRVCSIRRSYNKTWWRKESTWG